MHPRAYTFSGYAFLFLLVALVFAACGRSNLNDYVSLDGGPLFDGSPDTHRGDGGSCNRTTCPKGCCDSTGACEGGTALDACGTLGETCNNCTALGFMTCDPTLHACENVQANCAETCSGCCEGNKCLPGIDPNECGQSGQSCQHCASIGQDCTGHQCMMPACGPGNCNGCCFGDQCVSGLDPNACGTLGEQCQNCAGMGEQCQPASSGGGQCGTNTQCNPMTCMGCCSGNSCFAGGDNSNCGQGGAQCQNCTALGDVCSFGFCQQPPPPCNPMNCNGCCDAMNNCEPGTNDTSCGNFASGCQDCTLFGDVCQMQQCVPPATCNSSTCSGCCDASNVCEPGFLDTACGQNGAVCIDCTATMSTCDSSVMPRVCANMQTQCPAPYASCPAGTTTVAPPVLPGSCSSLELSNAAAACFNAHTAGCQAFFAFEQTMNFACYSCLLPFDYTFNELQGLFNCISPYVDMTCNGDTGCAIDCTNTSCSMCDPSAVGTCRAGVRSGQCSTYYSSSSCVLPAFGMGMPGNFCNPMNYGGSFGQWLQGVGMSYCF